MEKGRKFTSRVIEFRHTLTSRTKWTVLSLVVNLKYFMHFKRIVKNTHIKEKKWTIKDEKKGVSNYYMRTSRVWNIYSLVLYRKSLKTYPCLKELRSLDKDDTHKGTRRSGLSGVREKHLIQTWEIRRGFWEKGATHLGTAEGAKKQITWERWWTWRKNISAKEEHGGAAGRSSTCQQLSL